MRPEPEAPTTGEMVEELLDLTTGLGVMLLPLVVLAVPAVILLLPLAVPLIPLALLAAPLVAIRALWRLATT